MAPAGLSTRCVYERRLVWLPDGWQVSTQYRGEQHAEGDSRGGSMRLAPHIEEGNLAYGSSHLRVLSSGSERVASAHRGSKCRHALDVDPGQGASEGNCGPPVFELVGGLKQVRLATAVTKPTMIEDERRDTGRRKPLCEWPQSVAARPR